MRLPIKLETLLVLHPVGDRPSKLPFFIGKPTFKKVLNRQKLKQMKIIQNEIRNLAGPSTRRR